IVGAPVKPMRFIAESSVKLAIGVLCLFFLNIFGGAIGLHIPINVFTVVISGFLGLFGVASLAAIHLFILSCSPFDCNFLQSTDEIGKHPKLLHIKVDLREDRKSTRLNSSHVSISYAVFCLKKKKQYHDECLDQPDNQDATNNTRKKSEEDKHN